MRNLRFILQESLTQIFVTCFSLLKYPEATFASISTLESGGIRVSNKEFGRRFSVAHDGIILYVVHRNHIINPHDP